MSTNTPHTSLQLRSLIRANGELEVSLQEVQIPEPAADEVVVRIEATPINPSDLGLLFGPADMSTAKVTGTAERPVLSAQVPEKLMKAMAARADESMPVGNEGAGVVIKAGSSAAAQALLGKTVAMIGGAMYAQHRTIKVEQCLPLPNRHHPGRRRFLLREPADRAGHGGDHEARGPQGAGAHRRRIEPGADAQPHLPERRHTRW